MRVQMVLFALVTTPFLASVAQDQAGSIQNAGKCEVADANRSPTSWSRERPTDPKGRDRTGCSPAAPLPQQPPPPPPPPPGSVSISGTVYNDVSGWPGLGGWVVEVTGAANASAVSNADGSYALSGLPAGTYTICEVVKSGWTQTYPTAGTPCPTGKGYTFTLSAGGSGSFVDFANANR